MGAYTNHLNRMFIELIILIVIVAVVVIALRPPRK
jgi:hypothetical protein